MNKLIFAGFFSILSSAAVAAEIPVSDGFYVTETGLCSSSVEEIRNSLGLETANLTRTVHGTLFSDNYHSICDVDSVTRSNDMYSFTAYCDNRGVIWNDVFEISIISPSSFQQGDSVFSKC